MRAVRLLAALLLCAPLAAVAAPLEKSIDLGGGQTLTLVSIPKGRFVQGSPAAEPGRSDDEAQRTVSLSQDFWIGKTPITRGQFARFVTESGYRSESERGTSGGSGWDGTQLVQKPQFNWRNPGFAQTNEHPVTLVTFADALEFNAWLARKSGLYTALPTEAQWEYACRAGTEGATYDDGKAPAELAHTKSNSSDGTRPVGGKTPNAWGLFDLLGNVNEWVLDYHGPYVPGPIVDPLEERTNLGDKPRRGLRGGSWLREAKHARCAARYRNTPGSRNADNGFRVVAYDAPPASEAGTAAPVATPGAPASAPATTGGKAVVDSGTTYAPRPNPMRGGCMRFGPIGFFLLVAFLIFRKRGPSVGKKLAPSTKSPAYWSARIKLRPHKDGFKILAPPGLEGAELHYSYKLRQTLKTGNVVVRPSVDGQVVHLGHRPTQLKLTLIKLVDGNIERFDSDDTSDPDVDTTSRYYGAPSAY